jgi:hypothetical protein
MFIQNALIPTVDEPIFHEGHDDGHDDAPKKLPWLVTLMVLLFLKMQAMRRQI